MELFGSFCSWELQSDDKNCNVQIELIIYTLKNGNEDVDWGQIQAVTIREC